MYEYKDIAGLTRAVVVALCLYMLLDLASASLILAFPPDPAEPGLLDLVPAFDFLVLLACVLLVGRWIYRASTNAHSVSTNLSITPGWAIGAYFVPLVNIVLPYHAMRETWEASHSAAAVEAGRETRLVHLWWFLWLITNLLSGVAILNGLGEAPDSGVNLLAALLNVPLCLILIRIVRRLDRVQRLAASRELFA